LQFVFHGTSILFGFGAKEAAVFFSYEEHRRFKIAL
jgi:hypothetical protein